MRRGTKGICFMRKPIFAALLVFLCAGAFAKSKSLDEVIADAAAKFSTKIGDEKVNVRIDKIDTRDDNNNFCADLSSYVSRTLLVKLTDSDNIDVVERENDNIIEQERNYQQAGNVRDEDWAELGAEFGAQYSIYGDGKPKASGYVINLKMTSIETKKIISFQGVVSLRDKDLRNMLSKAAAAGAGTSAKKAKSATSRKMPAHPMTVAASGGLSMSSRLNGSYYDELRDKYSDKGGQSSISSGMYHIQESEYVSLTGRAIFNYRLWHGFGVETGAELFNGGGEIIIERDGNRFYAEKVKIVALDVPVCLSFQFKLFRTSLKTIAGLNLSVPLSCTYVYRGNGTGEKIDVHADSPVIPGFVFGVDYMIPLGRKFGLDFSFKFEGDFFPYSVELPSEKRELNARGSVGLMAGIYYML